MAFFEGTLLLLKIQSDFLICFIFHVSFCQQPLSFSKCSILCPKIECVFFCGRTTQTTLKVESFNHLSPGLGSLPCRVHVLHLELRYHQSAMAMFLWTRWARGGWCLIVGRKIYLSRGGNLSPLQCEFQCDVVDGLWIYGGLEISYLEIPHLQNLKWHGIFITYLIPDLYKNNLKRHTCCWYMLIHLIDVDAMAVLGDLFVSKSSDQISASAMLQPAGRDLGEPFRSLLALKWSWWSLPHWHWRKKQQCKSFWKTRWGNSWHLTRKLW